MAHRSPWLVIVAVVMGCGTPNPKIVESTEKARPAPPRTGSMTESDKIRALLEVVRASELEFTQHGENRSGVEAAADLEHRMNRMTSGIPTANLFVERVAAGRLRDKTPDTVRLEDGREIPLRDWMAQHLKALEGKVEQTPESEAASQTGGGESEVHPGILDALRVVEQSGLRFIAPARRSARGEIKGKAKEYSAPEFSSMLRKKWEFLGKGVDDLHTFIDVIATDALSSMEPYQVVHGDGTQEEFRPWLLQQIGAKPQAPELRADGPRTAGE